MIRLSDIINEENNEFQDENVASNLYYTSFPYSLRMIAGANEESLKKTMIEKNQWVKEKINNVDEIAALSIDRLKERLESCSELQTCDALLLLKEELRNYDTEKNVLIEFKRSRRSEVLNLLINNSKDSIINKCKGTAHIIENEIYVFKEEDGKEIIENTHFIMVYAEKADGVKDGPSIPEYSNAVKKVGRRQREAAKMSSLIYQHSNKKDEEIIDSFSKEVNKIGFASCTDEFLGLKAGEPQFKKYIKGKSKIRFFSLLSVNDLAKVTDNAFFDKMMLDYGEIK